MQAKAQEDPIPSPIGCMLSDDICTAMGREFAPLICECVCPDDPCVPFNIRNPDTCICECVEQSEINAQCTSDQIFSQTDCNCICETIENCLDPQVFFFRYMFLRMYYLT